MGDDEAKRLGEKESRMVVGIWKGIDGFTARKIFVFVFLIVERSKHGVFVLGIFLFTLGLEGGHFWRPFFPGRVFMGLRAD
jgi:hypothetical protein